ncbi:MAG TPA: methyl-accepting chemotaxis protein [Burkholderiaceae bacterium]|nr:methyl-accepting chemotaxis protein [Burkholderiaceae bacterium]HMX09950.1 methyl-accepting chemotaxis protein [Burkholderiaceae bacterium]HMY99041.1 methyl-accepting chemotaxis protein [Burkholderiaceae bacterium]HNG78759.1 methyl-accepting chemotaxis protein [Burkholderiaceae bacterium]
MSPSPSLSAQTIARARRTHWVPLAAAWISCAVSAALGLQSDNVLLGLFGGVILAGALSFIAWSMPTARSTGAVAAFLLMTLVGLQIHLAHGATEIHFGVFVLLAALVVYRDWLPILVGAVTIALHHAGFLWLQQSGWGVYCFTQPTFIELVKHAAYVVVESGLLMFLADQMHRDERRFLDVESVVDAVILDGTHVDLGRVATLTVRSSQARKLQELLGRIQALISELHQAIGSISVATREIASGNQDLSGRTEQTASSLQQTASSMEQLTDTVRQTAESARTANQLVSSASSSAQHGGEVVAQVVSNMAEISTSSRKIAEIIGVIDGIAFQTNILALNAAVEAARAGEQGRGFAVVAGEVRNLAQRSANAAREIKSLIGASVERVESGSQLVQQAGTVMTEIVSGVQRVTDIIGEISAAATEQSNGLMQVNSAVTQLDQMTQQNAALVEQSSAAAESLREQAEQVRQLISRFESAAA